MVPFFDIHDRCKCLVETLLSRCTTSCALTSAWRAFLRRLCYSFAPSLTQIVYSLENCCFGSLSNLVRSVHWVFLFSVLLFPFCILFFFGRLYHHSVGWQTTFLIELNVPRSETTCQMRYSSTILFFHLSVTSSNWLSKWIDAVSVCQFDFKQRGLPSFS